MSLMVFGSGRVSEIVEDNVLHYAHIEAHIGQLGERFDIHEIVFGLWGAVQMSQDLEGMGFTLVPFGQGQRMGLCTTSAGYWRFDISIKTIDAKGCLTLLLSCL